MHRITKVHLLVINQFFYVVAHVLGRACITMLDHRLLNKGIVLWQFAANAVCVHFVDVLGGVDFSKHQ